MKNMIGYIFSHLLVLLIGASFVPLVKQCSKTTAKITARQLDGLSYFNMEGVMKRRAVIEMIKSYSRIPSSYKNEDNNNDNTLRSIKTSN